MARNACPKHALLSNMLTQSGQFYRILLLAAA